MQIYKITNLIDGKFYIGKTVKTLEERFRRHIIRKSSPKLTNAIQKYGKQNFIIEMVELCDSIDILNEREKFWIGKLDAINKGYNLTTGGDGGVVVGEALEKIRAKATGRIVSKESRLKMSYSRSGKNNARAKRVLLSFNGIEICFFCIKDAADWLNVKPSTAMSWAKGQRKSRKGILLTQIGG